MKTIKLSCEFFPPNTKEGLDKLFITADKLLKINPEFFSVTYGAGGTTRERTPEVVYKLNEKFPGVATVSHLACIGSQKSQLKDLLTEYKNRGICDLVVLRGDLPSGAYDVGELTHANELVDFVRKEAGDHFKIFVAAYPEYHPEAKNPTQDMLNFKKKIDAGADAAITQFFFNTDAYFRFLDQCEKHQIDITIIPGILPISNWQKLKKFAHLCDAQLPLWLCKHMEMHGDDKESLQEYGLEVMTKMCEKLIAGGVDHLHFYTLNHSRLTLKLCERLGILSGLLNSDMF